MNKTNMMKVVCFSFCLSALQNPLPLAAAELFWDGSDTSADADGGSGIWSTLPTLLNWDDSATAGNATAWSTGDTAVFGGVPGTVTLGTLIAPGVVTFNAPGYVIDTAGHTLTLDLITGSGSFTKTGAGTLTTINQNSTYTGKIVIAGGLLKIGARYRSLGENDLSFDKITIRSNATLDVAGFYDEHYGVTIAGTGIDGKGAMINSGADTGSGKMQFPNIALSADATIGGSGNFYMIGSGYSQNFLNLNGYTLTKIGTNTFGLANTTVNAGAIRIEDGAVSLVKPSVATNTAMWIANSADTELKLNSNKLVLGQIAGGGTNGGSVFLGNAPLDVGWLNTSSTYAGSISGTGGVNKRGAGTLILTGESTYTGTTFIYHGGVVLEGSLTSKIIVGNDGWIKGTGSTTGALLFLGGPLVVTGDDETDPSLTVEGVDFSDPMRLEFEQGPSAGKIYEVLRYGSGGVINFQNLECGYRGTLTNDTANQIIKFIATADGHNTRTWNALDESWDTGVSTNWAEGDNLYYDGDHAVFGNIVTDVTINVFGDIYPASITIANDSNQYIFAGDGHIAGYVDLHKTGNGVCELATYNTYRGITCVESGTIKVGHQRAFGWPLPDKSPEQVLVSPGATIDFNGVLDAVYGYTIAGNGVNGSGALVNSGSAIELNRAQCTHIRLTADASIGGLNDWALLTSGWNATTLELNDHTLTKIGTNTITFVNTTISTGTVRIASGAISQHSTGIVEGSRAIFELDNAPGAMLQLKNISTALGSIRGGGADGGIISLGTASLTVGLLNEADTFSGSFTGSGPLIKAGTNVLVLSGSSGAYSGDVLINEGILKLDHYDQPDVLGSARYDVNKIQVAKGATFDIGGLDNTRYGVTISGSGVDGAGALINSGPATDLGRIQTPFLNLTGDATIGGSGDFAMINAVYHPNTIALNGFRLTKSGPNTFTVATTTIATGKVHIAQGVFAQHSTKHNNSTGIDATYARFTFANIPGVELLLNDKPFAVGSLEGGGASGGLVSLGTGQLTLGALATNAVFSGTISGNGGITKIGSGSQSFNGVYDYSGATVISNGTLAVNGYHQAGGDYIVMDGSILAGTGTVALATGNTVTIEKGGAISPGTQLLKAGTLQLSSLTMTADTQLIIDNPADTLLINGDLSVDNAIVTVNDITQFDRNQIYPLLICQGTVTGNFSTTTTDPLWIVSRRGNTFALVYSSGTFIMVR
jgi:autotransporter-associated beta strand protein